MISLNYTELVIGILGGGTVTTVINRLALKKKLDVESSAVVNKILRETVMEIQGAYKKEIIRLEKKIDELHRENSVLRNEITALRHTIQTYEDKTQCSIDEIKKKLKSE